MDNVTPNKNWLGIVTSHTNKGYRYYYRCSYLRQGATCNADTRYTDWATGSRAGDGTFTGLIDKAIMSF